VFEERVSRSLNRLGVMTREEIDDLPPVQELMRACRRCKAQSPAGRAPPPAQGRREEGPRKRATAKAPRKAKR